jgi:DNA-binding IscR family transcriptional regulator
VEDLSVGHVIEALEGPIYLTPCCSGAEDCRQEAACNIKLPVRRIQEVLQQFIYGLSLASFREAGQGLTSVPGLGPQQVGDRA